MAEAPENLVLELLRAIRVDVAQLREDNREFRKRIGQLELGQARIETQIAELSVRVDRIHDRLERVEQRLGLVDGAPA